MTSRATVEGRGRAADRFDCRDAFAASLVELARSDERVVVVVNDSVGSSKLAAFRDELPERLINVGIAEQTMVGVAAGLANGGHVPFVCAASCFLTARALEQIKVDAAYSAANVKLVGISSGMAYGALGATHHSIEDIAWMRAIADLAIVVPADPVETAGAVRAAYEHDGPVFIRTSRTPVPAVHGDGYRFRFGLAPTLRDGDDVTLVANGTMVSVAVDAADALAGDGVRARVLNVSSVSPVDAVTIVQASEQTPAIVTLEEHTVRGGLGGLVAELCVTRGRPVPMRMLGVPGVFAPTGSPEFLFEHFGLTVAGACAAVHELLG